MGFATCLTYFAENDFDDLYLALLKTNMEMKKDKCYKILKYYFQTCT